MSRIANYNLGAMDAHRILNFNSWAYDASSFFPWAISHPEDASPIITDLMLQSAALGHGERLQGFWHAVGVSTDADYKQLRTIGV